MKPLRSLVAALTSLHAASVIAQKTGTTNPDAVYLYGYRQTKGLPRVTRPLASASQPRARLARRRAGQESRRKK